VVGASAGSPDKQPLLSNGDTNGVSSHQAALSPHRRTSSTT